MRIFICLLLFFLAMACSPSPQAMPDPSPTPIPSPTPYALVRFQSTLTPYVQEIDATPAACGSQVVIEDRSSAAKLDEAVLSETLEDLELCSVKVTVRLYEESLDSWAADQYGEARPFCGSSGLWWGIVTVLPRKETTALARTWYTDRRVEAGQVGTFQLLHELYHLRQARIIGCVMEYDELEADTWAFAHLQEFGGLVLYE